MTPIKQLIPIYLVLLSSIVFSQEKPQIQLKNEIGLDFLELFQSNKIELSYNYLYNNHNSIGTSLTFFLRDETYLSKNLFQEIMGIDVNYKHYFSTKNNQGFYVEGLIKYGWYRSKKTLANQRIDDDYHSIDLGVGVGYKYVSKENYFIEVNARWNENIYNTLYKEKGLRPPSSVPTFSVIIGKRF